MRTTFCIVHSALLNRKGLLTAHYKSKVCTRRFGNQSIALGCRGMMKTSAGGAVEIHTLTRSNAGGKTLG